MSPPFPDRPRRRMPFPVLAAGALASAALIGAELWARKVTRLPELAAAFERGAYSRVLVLNPPGSATARPGTAAASAGTPTGASAGAPMGTPAGTPAPGAAPARTAAAPRTPASAQTPAPARVTTNRWGMRGEDPPADWEARETWLALGSSTTLCPYQDDSLAWPARMQARLRAAGVRAWIGNAGADGITAVSLEALLDRVARAAGPKGVLILPGGPEMSRDLSDEGRARPNPYDAALARRLQRMDEAPPLRKRFGLARLFHRGRDGFAHDGSGHRPWEPPRMDAPEGELPPVDSLLPSLPVYRVRLRRMGSLARGLGMRAVFLTHPIAYGSDSAWAMREARAVRLGGRERRLSCATERRLRDAFNAALLEVCASDGLECFDLAGAMSGEPRWFYDGSHFNDAGSDRAAALIAAYLLSHPAFSPLKR